MADKQRGRNAVVTCDSDESVTISNKITIAMLKALSRSQRKRPDSYLEDLIKHQYLYL